QAEPGADEGGARDDGSKGKQGDTGATGEKVGKAESDEQARKDEEDDKGKKGRDDNGSDDEEAKPEKDEKAADAGDLVLVELAVLPGSVLVGRSASDILLRTRYGLNLLAVSRQGQRSMVRLRSLALRAGDLLLMQGAQESIAEFASDNGCVPLAERELRIPDRRKAITATLVMLASVGVAAFGLLPAATAFLAGVLASMALRTVPPRAVYDAVDWPVIVLLAALIPVAGAMESSGAADLVARVLLDGVAQGHAIGALVLILVVTMFLSDVMNNAATAAVMCPIAIGTAAALGASADAFLMAVAIGASCAFLTPIGHQNNTLILGPGGFRFGDYWRLGLPLELLVIAVAVPLLLVVWPL
ncbi:MAG: anion permease, partial [Burkholderiaceae bacterium]|nr:anion permease [Burkholderiaceae bacterium]